MTADSSLPRSLEGKTYLICGANGGFGDAAARGIAQAGAQVVLLGRRIPKLTRLYDDLLAANAREPAIYPLDLSGATPQDYMTLAETLARECGQLDGIVHAAAEFKELASLENAPLEDWFTGMHVNLTAPFLLTQACLPLLRQAENAHVVFLLNEPASVNRAFWGSYGVASHALQGLVSILHSELENASIRIHGVTPGPMRTSLRARAFFAENPGDIPLPSAYVPALIELLNSDQPSASPLCRLSARATVPPARNLGLNTFSAAE